MLSKVQAACIDYITSEWKILQPSKSTLVDQSHKMPPWGVWIEYHGPIPKLTDITWRRPEQVWFLEEHGLKEHDPDEYVRFKAVVWEMPWAAERFKPREAIYGSPYHEIAQTAICEIIGSEEIFLDMQWGNLYGIGYRMKLNGEGKLEVIARRWIS